MLQWLIRFPEFAEFTEFVIHLWKIPLCWTHRQNCADVYIKPWCRIGPYIVGIMMGYLLHITDKQKPKIHKVFLIYLTLLFFSGLGVASEGY